jgi:hypothetical protein
VKMVVVCGGLSWLGWWFRLVMVEREGCYGGGYGGESLLGVVRDEGERKMREKIIKMIFGILGIFV